MGESFVVTVKKRTPLWFWTTPKTVNFRLDPDKVKDLLKIEYPEILEIKFNPPRIIFSNEDSYLTFCLKHLT